jgi:hypothetical protein
MAGGKKIRPEVYPGLIIQFRIYLNESLATPLLACFAAS